MQKIYDNFYPECSQKSFHILCMRVWWCCMQYHVIFSFLIMASHSISRYCMEYNSDRNVKHKSNVELIDTPFLTLIARFMGPTWGPSGADRPQVGPMLAPWTLLSGHSQGGATEHLSWSFQRISINVKIRLNHINIHALLHRIPSLFDS